LGDKIQIFSHIPLVKLIPSSGIARIVEDLNVEDSYTDSLEG
jgi:hypothetical protein